jgi:hypothetical protein
VGQPLRCWNDPADRFFVRLLRHDRLRRAAHARHRLPVSAVLSERRGARIAQIDIRPEHIGRRTPMDLGLVGDVKETLRALLPRLKNNDAHLKLAQRHYVKARSELDDLAKTSLRRGIIHPQQIAKAISKHAAPDAIFTCDVGLPTVWAARYVEVNGRRRLLGSFWHGSMANAMAQSAPRRPHFERDRGWHREFGPREHRIDENRAVMRERVRDCALDVRGIRKTDPPDTDRFSHRGKVRIGELGPEIEESCRLLLKLNEPERPVLKTTTFTGSLSWARLIKSPISMVKPPSPESDTTCPSGWAKDSRSTW